MAHPTSLLLHFPTSSLSFHSSSETALPTTFLGGRQRRLCFNYGNCRLPSGVVVKSGSDDVSVIQPQFFSPPPPGVDERRRLSSLKLELLNTVSGLNRGLAAREDDLKKADTAAREVEAAGGYVDLRKDLDKLQGKWKLVYSSAFSGGGSRPIGRLLPITLEQVFQQIDVGSKDFNSIVGLKLNTPWPLPELEGTARLAQKFELKGRATIRIVLGRTTVKTTGLPLLQLPRIPYAFWRPCNITTDEFQVTFLDNKMQITRDRGELKVFVLASRENL